MSPAWSAILNLAGVALGGVVAALAGLRSSRRTAAADGLTALVVMRDMRRERHAGETDRDALLQARAQLLAAGCSWVVVEMHERATLAARRATWQIELLHRPGSTIEQQRFASRLLHPSRFFTRPLIQLGDVFEQALAEQIERPLRNKLISPLRVHQLKRVAALARVDNEAVRIPVEAGSFAQEVRDAQIGSNISAILSWPKRRILANGLESPVEYDEQWYPAEARFDDPQ